MLSLLLACRPSLPEVPVAACPPDLPCDVPPPPEALFALGTTPYVVPQPDYLEPMPVPDDNPLTHAGVALGRRLFYDPMLSGNNTQSCASCHDQAKAFTDGEVVSTGANGLPVERNAMSLVNLAWTAPYFWDGRVDTLEALVPEPIQRPDEMDDSMPALLRDLQAHPDYPAQFEAAFPGVGATEETVAFALSQFLRTLVSFNSRADLLDSGAIELTELEARGNALMVDGFPKGDPGRTADMCDTCHKHSAGVIGGASEMGLFTTSETKNNGLGPGNDFVVPTIRNLTVTAPFMHDGRMATLEDVVDHYATGMLASPTMEPPLAVEGVPIQLGTDAADREALVAVLGIFTDPVFLTHPAFAAP